MIATGPAAELQALSQRHLPGAAGYRSLQLSERGLIERAGQSIEKAICDPSRSGLLWLQTDLTGERQGAFACRDKPRSLPEGSEAMPTEFLDEAGDTNVTFTVATADIYGRCHRGTTLVLLSG